MRRPQILTVALLALTVTCREASAPATIVAVGSESATLSSEGLETFYGPERFTRAQGKPETITRSISTVGFEAPFVLRVTSGDAAGANRVSSGSVLLDGVELLGQQSFNQTQHEWAIAVSPTGTSTLTVSLASAPGSYLDISLDGKRSATLFCPDGAEGSVTSLRQAIEQTPVNGTVLVCDGLHNVANVLIDKPITIRSQNPHGATLGDAEPGGTASVGNPILLISGVSSGLVRIADLSFAVADKGIATVGAFDRVQVDSVSFTGGPNSTVALRLDGNPSSGARVDVTYCTFSGLQLGVWPITSLETNVRNSRFDRFTGGAVVYSHGNTPTTQSFGRTEDNAFTNCSSAGCIRVLTAAPVVVARNHLEAMNQEVTLGAITATTAFQATGQVFEDNVIISRRTAAPANTPQGWMFQNAFFVSNASGSNSIVRRNTIVDAHSGLRIEGDVQVTDNKFSGGVFAFRQNSNRTVTFQRNDVVGSLSSFTAPNSAGQYQCNWWGSGAGPTSPPANVPAARYTPWATEPIALTGVTCVVPPPPPPPGSLNIVRVCAVAAGPIFTVPTAAEAYAAVATGGTILFCDGTHTVQNLRIAKALTIRNEGPGKPMLDALGLRSNFDIRDVVGGAVLVQGLRFRGTWLVTTQPNNGYGANINIEGSYNTITIEDSEFFPSGQLIAYDNPGPGQTRVTYNSGIWTWSTAGNGITVSNNTFTGGDIGVGGEGADIRVQQNRFSGQSNAAVHYGRGRMVVTDNDVTDCGTAWCIAGFGYNTMTVSDNRLQLSMNRQTSRAILVDGEVAVVSGNTITATGGTRNPNDAATFPITFAAIAVHATNRNAPNSVGTVSGNTISGAFSGIDFAVIQSPGTLTADAHDNLVGGVVTPFSSSGTQSLVHLRMNRNDFTDYVNAGRQGNTFGSFDLRCNWWGQAAGPAGSYPSAWQSAVEPWAVTPIAGQPGVACP